MMITASSVLKTTVHHENVISFWGFLPVCSSPFISAERTRPTTPFQSQGIKLPVISFVPTEIPVDVLFLDLMVTAN